MADTPRLLALAQGLAAGVVALIVLAVRAWTGGGSGVTFDDLFTAAAVGVAVGLVSAFTWSLGVGRRISRMTQADAQDWTSYESRRTEARETRVIPQSGNGGTHDRFDSFTDRGRHALIFAQEEAQRLNHPYIGTEHLLLGLVRGVDSTAARVLGALGLDLAKVRTATEFIIGRGDQRVSGEVGLTPRAKRVIKLAIDEARGLGHRHIGTEHLLLGLVREGEGIAAGVLASLGVTPDRTRAEVLRTIEAGEDSG
jgi:Clp amino terminal domain, pathogenicity island component